MAIGALISSLVLLAAGPATLTLAQADTSPVTTRQTSPDKQAAADALAKGEAPFPSGAPADDYGLMGWCYGALSGHLNLYAQVLPEVKRIEGEFPDKDRTIADVMKDYAAQHAAGEKILTTYARVISLEETAGKTHGQKRPAVIARGRQVWKGSDKADPRQLAQLWMSWGLPDRCQATAKRLAPGRAE